MAKMKYKMSSRATILLGRESVSRVDGAIIELVKNTYDADAGFCCLCFDVEHDQIYILDNGVGMTKETIKLAGCSSEQITNGSNIYQQKNVLNLVKKALDASHLIDLAVSAECTQSTIVKI